jgi:hypothetical protein
MGQHVSATRIIRRARISSSSGSSKNSAHGPESKVTVQWFNNPNNVEFDTPLGIYARDHHKSSARLRIPAVHSVFGPCQIVVSENREYDTLGAIVRLEFPNPELNGAYSTRFVEKAEPRVQAEERSAA